MNEIMLTARHALGNKVSAAALVPKDGFSARYDLSRLEGVFLRPAHKLVGQSYIRRILVLDTAKGGVASAWMLREMQSRNMSPVAIVFNMVHRILAQGAALGDISMLAGFDFYATEVVPHGEFVEFDPHSKRCVRYARPRTGPRPRRSRMDSSTSPVRRTSR